MWRITLINNILWYSEYWINYNFPEFSVVHLLISTSEIKLILWCYFFVLKYQPRFIFLINILIQFKNDFINFNFVTLILINSHHPTNKRKSVTVVINHKLCNHYYFSSYKLIIYNHRPSIDLFDQEYKITCNMGINNVLCVLMLQTQSNKTWYIVT